MSVLEEVLLEEYHRTLRIKRAIEAEQESLPKGSVQKKLIHNVICYYLVYREGNKVKSKYINKQQVEDYRKSVQKRRENERYLKNLNENIRKIEKALGKELVNEYTKKGVY